MRAIGYHGTSVERAERILAGGFQPSRNDYDWLGDGAYFFQDSPSRAWEWARERFGGDAAVLGAEIDLSDCLDLLAVHWRRLVAVAHKDYVRQLAISGAKPPRQTAGAHRLDRKVINYAAEVLARDGVLVRSVRAAFEEGPAIYEGSALRTHSHVQIAVREISAIRRIWMQTEGVDDARS